MFDLKQQISDADVRAALKIIQTLLAHPHLSTTQLREKVGINNKRFHKILQVQLKKGIIERSKNGVKYEHNVAGWIMTFLAEAIAVQGGVEQYIRLLLENELKNKDTRTFSVDIPIPASLGSMYLLKQLRRFLAPIVHLSVLETNLSLDLKQKIYLKAFFGDELGKDINNRVEELQKSETTLFKMNTIQDIWVSLNGNFFTFFAKINPVVHQHIKELELFKEKSELDAARQLFKISESSVDLAAGMYISQKGEPSDLTLVREFTDRVSLKKVVDYAENYKSRKGAHIRINIYKEDCLSWTFVLPGGTEEPTIFVKPNGLFLSKSVNKGFSEKRIKNQLDRVWKTIIHIGRKNK